MSIHNKSVTSAARIPIVLVEAIPEHSAGVVIQGFYITLPAMSSKVFGRAFFKKLAGRGEFAQQTHSEAGESPRRSPQRAKLPQPSESEEKGGLGEETPKGVASPIHRSFAPLNAKHKYKPISLTP